MADTKRIIIGSEVNDDRKIELQQKGSMVILPVGIYDATGNQIVSFPITTGLSIPPYDYVSLSYTGENLTGVVFKTGGASGTTVATLTLAYSGSNLTSVTKS